MEVTKKIYLETLKSELGRSVFHYLPDFVLPIFNIIMPKFKRRNVNQIWWEGWDCMQPLDNMAFDHVIKDNPMYPSSYIKN